MKGRRGRSKTQKICMSSDQSKSPTYEHGSSYQNSDIDNDNSSPNYYFEANLAKNRTPRLEYTNIDKNDVPIQTPGSDRRVHRIKSLNKIDIRSPIVPRNSVLTPGSYNFGLDRAHSADIYRSNHTELSSLNTSRTNPTMASRLLSGIPDKLYAMRDYYNDFTTIDWAKAFTLTNRFNYELHHNKWIVDNPSNSEERESINIPFYYKTYLVLGKWVLIIIIGFLFSLIAYLIDKIEILLVGLKHGYCRSNWFASQVSCCVNSEPTIPPPPTNSVSMNIFKSGYVFSTKPNNQKSTQCPDWISWSTLFERQPYEKLRLDFVIYVVLTLVLAYLACIVTLSTKITSRLSVASSKKNKMNMDESSTNLLGQNSYIRRKEVDDDYSYDENEDTNVSARVMYTACGSGVPEVKTILSGFVIRRFLGTYTLFAKTIALIFAIASGMALGKEGPYVHLATAVGNIMTRFFPYINNNDFMKKQILSASASSGVALAFGSPLGGVLFILEEINHYLPSHQLFQIFFCAIISTLFLKFLNPYGTGNTVLFELKYTSDWNAVELIFFIIIGISGGIFGAFFVRFVGWWPKKFRQLKMIKNHPIIEVFLISLLTGLVTFWNPYTKQASSELVLDLATSCNSQGLDLSLCPVTHEQFVKELGSLIFALVVKMVLTCLTFGLKLPCGIYVPSMVVGALYGRTFAMFIQWSNYKYNLNLGDQGVNGLSTSVMRFICSPDSSNNECVDLGIYSMISAGAFMAGITRMNITLVTILFELTSSYTYVLPISISIAVANWLGSLIEKKSLYESLLVLNDYPFMSPETEALDPFVTAGEIITDIDSYDQDDDEELNLRRRSRAINDTTGSRIYTSKRPPFHANKITNFDSLESNEYSTNPNFEKLYIDISASPYVAASLLQSKLILLADKLLLDGCIPLIKNEVCVGLIYFSELEYCLDKLKEFCLKYEIMDDIFCKLLDEVQYPINENVMNPLNHNLSIVRNISDTPSSQLSDGDYFNYGATADHCLNNDPNWENLQTVLFDLSNLIRHVDYSPIFLNYDSELSLAHLIFDKIGNRVIVLLKEGRYYGVLQKKVLIDYCRREESK
ncbi:unnamed protein product [Debaryomyces tyrocola]|nr:unnamed protein product [Debaryomyces tyrocola]